LLGFGGVCTRDCFLNATINEDEFFIFLRTSILYRYIFCCIQIVIIIFFYEISFHVRLLTNFLL
jgi:hypothetical protein